ncbi:NADH:flavin oxidoreductase/NADH oxidase [Umbelopsis sp. PMI_123]|nr:NADH:flavin oxidoreductase/NADH oxidase [Umbelopsis sp. PMI_123]
MPTRQQQTEWNVVPGNKVPIGAPLEPTNSLLFSPLTIKNTTFHNRIVVSPMCQYSCVNGVFDHLYHMAHYGSYALRGPGLMFIEASGVLPEGRISPEDMGIWSPEHRDAFIPIIQLSHKTGVKIGIQLAHAGRKASTYSLFRKSSSAAREGVADEDGGWTPEGPSAIPWNEHFRVPHEMTEEDIARTVAAFGQSAKWCDEVGFDVIEIHGAHGYLIPEFLSPLSNRRTDKYGGSFENRIRFLLEVLESVQQNWPKDKPLFVRLSVTEWHDNPNEESWDLDQTLKLAAILKEKGVDLIDCSSGGNTSTQKFKPADPQNPMSMFQVPFAAAIKQKVGIKTGAVGFITHPYQMESIIRSNQADLVFMAREFLRDPNLVYNAADELGVKIQWLPQHERGRMM